MTGTLPTSGGDPQDEYDALCKAVGDLLMGPDHPVITEAAFKQEREKYTELQASQAEFAASIEELELVIPNIETAEKLLTAIQADLITHKDALSDFAAELGSTAFAGLQAGELGDNAHFTMRKELQTKIDTLLQQRALLISGSDAGIFEKTKNKARQLKLTGQIKLLNLKIKGTDRSLGDLLLSAEDDDVIRCSHTEKLLDTIANQRRKLKASEEALSQAESSLAEKQTSAAETLGRAGVPDAASLKLELNAARSEQNVNWADITNNRESVVSKALDYEWLRDDDELRDKLEELAVLRSQLSSKHSSNPNRRKSPDNGNAESLQTIEHDDTREPTLWNPNAAGFWSLLLTPAFGAWLHAKNWKELGHPDKAKTSMLWVYAFIAMWVTIWFVSAATSPIPRVIFGVFIAAWWMKSGNEQYKYVSEQCPSYHKKGWTRPLVIAVVSVAWIIGLIVAINEDREIALAKERLQLVQTAAVQLVNESILELAKTEFERTLKLAKTGAAEAQTNLGVMYHEGTGVPQDHVEAVKWFRMAAEQEYAAAQYNLGVMYRDGTGVPQDHVEAVKWFRMAAEQEYAAAQTNLGLMYDNGTGVPQDHVEAVKWYRMAAEQDYAAAQTNLGLMYADGTGVPQDHVEAVKWHRMAAEQGLAEAQYNLGVMYVNGTGVPQGHVEAVKWFRMAAEQGSAMAQYNLGVMCRDGQGVPQDDAEAVKWFRMAAEQELAEAQYNLGVMYADGTGVPQDHVEAYAWWSVAAAGGSADAAKNRDIVKESLSGSQLAQGQRRATELLEKHGSK
jgi:hypothetical protein